jgi:hypothetical protein
MGQIRRKSQFVTSYFHPGLSDIECGGLDIEHDFGRKEVIVSSGCDAPQTLFQWLHRGKIVHLKIENHVYLAFAGKYYQKAGVRKSLAGENNRIILRQLTPNVNHAALWK